MILDIKVDLQVHKMSLNCLIGTAFFHPKYRQLSLQRQKFELFSIEDKFDVTLI